MWIVEVVGRLEVFDWRNEVKVGVRFYVVVGWSVGIGYWRVVECIIFVGYYWGDL